MKTAIGCVMMLAGLVLGLYVGVWLCLVGGIVQLINGAMAVPVDAMAIAIGVARVLTAGFFGWLSAAVLLFPGAALVQEY